MAFIKPQDQKMFSPNRMGQNALSSLKMPEPGKGFIYRALVDRKGLSTAVYVGLTTTSVKKRFSTRAMKVKSMYKDIIEKEEDGKSGKKRIIRSFPLEENWLEVMMRTAQGITDLTEKQGDPMKYITVQYIGEYSLYGLSAAEKFFISGRTIKKSVDPNNYAGARRETYLNKSAGGEGFMFSTYSFQIKSISAFYYLRDEARTYYPETELDILYDIASIIWVGVGKKNYQNDKIRKVKATLLKFFAIKDAFIAYTDDRTSIFNTQLALQKALENILAFKPRDLTNPKLSNYGEDILLKLEGISVLDYFMYKRSFGREMQFEKLAKGDVKGVLNAIVENTMKDLEDGVSEMVKYMFENRRSQNNPKRKSGSKKRGSKKAK